MENASKALIIAGAILISIVLITLGVVIIGQGQGIVNNTNMDDQAVSTWNQKFNQYEGNAVTGSNVNALINAVTSNNLIAERDQEDSHLITIVPTSWNPTCTANNTRTVGSATGTASLTRKAQTGKTYIVQVTGTHNSGYISEITITENN